MKIIEVKGFQFKVDDHIYLEYHKCNFTVNVSRGKPCLQLRNSEGKYRSFAQVILGINCRVIYLDNDKTNLLLENLDVNTKERQQTKSRYYYEKNRTKIISRVRDYYLKHTEKVKLYQKNRPKSEEFRQNNRIKSKQYHRTLTGKFTNIKHQNRSSRSKRRRELIVNLSLEDYDKLLQNGCFYCKKDLFLESGGSLDRINNDLGYFKENVLPCCGDCNKLRGNRLTVEETQVAVNAILEYRKCHGGSNKGLIKLEK